jgi:hypothetical protein
MKVSSHDHNQIVILSKKKIGAEYFKNLSYPKQFNNLSFSPIRAKKVARSISVFSKLEPKHDFSICSVG